MKKISYWAVLLLFMSACGTFKPSEATTVDVTDMDFSTPFERTENYSATHEEMIAFYEKLEATFTEFRFQIGGRTDVGRPLHLGIVSLDGDFDAASLRKKGKTILMINNAIHPGEPAGVDATMMFVRDVLTKEEMRGMLDSTVIVFIPMYNVGGALNRGSFSRANQEGPTGYGFRGNARNYDLNRDFIKCDTKNAQSFNQIFTEWRPHILVDNHTSNGADYQYVMTLIPTQHNKLPSVLSDYLTSKMLPRLYKDMAATNYEMTPYVYARNTPDDGIMGFLDLPRYSSGYAALFNTLSFMPEAHMLKPYQERVKGTYAFMKTMLNLIKEDHTTIINNRKIADEAARTQTDFAINWQLNMDAPKAFVNFKGYAAKYKQSEVSGKDRLYYDRNEPYTKSIPFFNEYKPTLTIKKPTAYIIPQGYSHLVYRLEWNGVTIKRLLNDTEMEVETYHIKDFKTSDAPYEGHYLHSAVKVETKKQKIQYYKGDYVVKMNQIENQYIMHCLEPQAADAFFAWNFFDAILQQKEYFSAYVFEDVAAQLLKDNPDLQRQLNEKRKENGAFAGDAYAQLQFIYERSPYYEATHNRYPIGRLMN